MSALPMTEVAQLAYDAGFRGSDLVTAVAVAAAESGLDPRAYNGNTRTGDNSIGLWQINMLGHLEAPRLKLFGITSRSELFTPATNARAAHVLYAARHGFADWSTYNHGSHRPHLDDAQRAVTTFLAGQRPTPHPTPGPRPQFILGRMLVNTGDPKVYADVKAVQHRLMELGYGFPAFGADGVYGDETEGVVRRAQRRFAITADGRVGPVTTGKLGGRWTGPR